MSVFPGAICRLVGCSRVARNGYEYCARCGTSYWQAAERHGFASPLQAAFDPVAAIRHSVTAILSTITRPLAVIDDLEGSELFVEEPASAGRRSEVPSRHRSGATVPT